MGIVLLLGAILALIATSLQRDAPQLPTGQTSILAASTNCSRRIPETASPASCGQVHAFKNEGVMIHYVVLFTVIGALPAALLSGNRRRSSHLDFDALLQPPIFRAVARPTSKPTVSNFEGGSMKAVILAAGRERGFVPPTASTQSA